MKHTTTIVLLFLALALVNCTIKETIHAARDTLNYDKRRMPEKVGDTAEDVQSGIDHAHEVVEDIHAIKDDGIIKKAKDAYEAVKDGLKIPKDVKDAVVDSQKITVAGATDSAKEAVHIYRKHENLHEKIEDVKEFIVKEVKESNDAIDKALHGDLKENVKLVTGAVTGGVKGAADIIKSAYDSRHKDADEGLKEVGEKIKEAVGLEDEHKSLGDKIKSAVGLGDDKEDKAEEKKEKLEAKIKQTIGLEEDKQSLGDKIKEAVGLGEKKESLGDKIKEAVGLEEKKESVGDKIKHAVGLEDEHQSLGDKIKDAVGLGDDKSDKKKKRKHDRDVDL